MVPDPPGADSNPLKNNFFANLALPTPHCQPPTPTDKNSLDAVVLTEKTFCQYFSSNTLGIRATEKRYHINTKRQNVVVVVGTIWPVQVVRHILGNYSPSWQAPP